MTYRETLNQLHQPGVLDEITSMYEAITGNKERVRPPADDTAAAVEDKGAVGVDR